MNSFSGVMEGECLTGVGSRENRRRGVGITGTDNSSSFVAKRSEETVVAGRGRVDFVETGGETRWLYEKEALGRRMDAVGEVCGKLS